MPRYQYDNLDDQPCSTFSSILCLGMSFLQSREVQVVDSVLNSAPGNNNIINTHVGDKIYQGFSKSESGLSTLTSKVAFNALHDSEARYPQPNVLPGTREEIMRRLSQWVEDPDKKSRVYWVNGAAGVGKSAIAQALSEKYIETGHLAATFFFSRNDSTRDKLDPFIPTIAHQLAASKPLKPHIAAFMDHTISSSPGIFHNQSEYQFQTLIEEPCALVDKKLWSQLPRLVIIDGVDECIEVASQKRLLQMIQNAAPTLPLDFLIFSRPEPHITHIFHHQSFIPSPTQLALGDFTQAVWDDIKKYLCHEFSRIQGEHWHTLPTPQDSWPGADTIRQLLCKATGQFIYAATIIKFIDTGKVPITPDQRLQVILQTMRVVTSSSSPYPDLDQLYSQILQLCVNKEGKLQKILQLILKYSASVGLQSLYALGEFLALNPDLDSPQIPINILPME
ncbi:hypothetical protein L218DRAFT_992286 [Marasmius fiardii PR-910]|nr:hypothetical protein L218DRAFT_992286 [Marasmius fiardii PR-910]